MKKDHCKYCTYFKILKREDGSERNYCNDMDCTVDPSDPACNYYD